MKKLLLPTMLMFLAVMVGHAQQRADSPTTITNARTFVDDFSTAPTNHYLNGVHTNTGFEAVGSTRGGCPDVLLEEDFQSQMIPGSWTNLDLDGNTDANGRPDEWYIRFDEQSTSPGDTNWVASSSSWFTTLATANNWLILDAVSICDPSFELRWWSAPFEGPTYMDGYTVLLSPDEINNPGDFSVTLAEFAEGDENGNVGPGIAHTDFNGNNGVLQQWSVSLGAYNGQTVRVAFVHDSYDDNILSLDNIMIQQDVAYDLAAENVYRGSDYYLFPLNQVRPLTPTGDVTNQSQQLVNNPTLTFDIIDNALQNQFTNTQTTSTVAGGATESFTAGASFTPPMMEEFYAVVGTASGDETDPDLTNNTDSAFFFVNDTIFSRETGNPDGALSIGAGSSGVMANHFELVQNDWISSISVFLNSPTIGDTLIGRVYDLSGAMPTTLLASTDTFFVTSDQAGLYTLPITGGPVNLAAGSYAVGIEETVASEATVGTEGASFVPGEAWVFFQGAWGNPEAFNFNVAFTIRLNMVSSLTTGISDAEDGTFRFYPNPSNGSFFLSVNGDVSGNGTLEILDISGKLVHSESLQMNSGTQHSFSLNLADGIYLARLTTDAGIITKRIVVHR